MTVIIIPFWIIRIWRIHHSNFNAWMTVIIIILWSSTHHGNNNTWMTVIIFILWTIRIWRTHHGKWIISTMNDRYHYTFHFLLRKLLLLITCLIIHTQRRNYRDNPGQQYEFVCSWDLVTQVRRQRTLSCGIVEYWYKGGLSLACNGLAPGAHFVSAI